MDTKKAIRFLRNHFRIGIYEKISKEIITLLKELDKKSIRGEKYEAMWGELLKNKGRLGLTDEIRDLPNWDLHVIMKNIEQKYFPKGANTNEAKMDEPNI